MADSPIAEVPGPSAASPTPAAGRVSAPSRNRTTLAAASAWALACIAPALRVWEHGPVARRGAVTLLIVSAVWTFLFSRLARRPASWVVCTVSVIAGAAVTVPALGRAPVVLCGVTLLIVLAALLEPPLFRWVDDRPPGRTVVPIIPVVLAQVVWLSSGALVVVAGLLLVAACLLVAGHLRFAPVVGADRRIDEFMRHVSDRCAAGSRRSVRRVASGLWSLRDACAELFPLGGASGRRGTVPIWVAAAMAAGLMLPVLRRLAVDPTAFVMDTNDVAFHVRLAVDQTSLIPFDVPAPHPIFHLGVAALHPLLGESWAAVVVLLVAVVGTVLALSTTVRRQVGGSAPLPPVWAAAFALVWIVSESPTVLFQAATGDDGRFAIVHFWGSPTEVVFVPFAILVTLAIGDLIEHPDRYVGRWGPRAAVVVVVVVTALAKPSLALILAPATLALMVLSPRWRSRRPGQVIALFVVPSLVMAALQTMFLMSNAVATGRSGFELAPLEVASEVLRGTGVEFWALPLVLAAMATAVHERLRQDPCFVVSGVGLLVAIPPMLLLRETGPRADDGALLKLGFAAITLITVFLLRACWFELRDRAAVPGSSARWKVPLLCAGIALLVVSGIVAYLEAVDLSALWRTAEISAGAG